jgi:hypothetical protein
MLYWTLMFLVIALIAGVLGFTGGPLQPQALQNCCSLFFSSCL